MYRKTLALAVAGAVAALTQVGAAGAQPGASTAARQGGLSITPSILENTAFTGASGTVTITNTTGRRLRMTVSGRPWRQSRRGAVAADRRRRLSRLRVRPSRFRLQDGGRRTVRVTLGRVPPRGSLYGGLEVVGRPARRRRGINVVYRLVGSVRFNPTSSRRRHRLGTGAARVTGKGRNRAVTLRVRNRGNTIDPVGGSVRLTGPGTGRSATIRPLRILPGKAVDLPLASTRGLRRGRYTGAVSLTQAGRNITSTTRRFRIR